MAGHIPISQPLIFRMLLILMHFELFNHRVDKYPQNTCSQCDFKYDQSLGPTDRLKLKKGKLGCIKEDYDYVDKVQCYQQYHQNVVLDFFFQGELLQVEKAAKQTGGHLPKEIQQSFYKQNFIHLRKQHKWIGNKITGLKVIRYTILSDTCNDTVCKKNEMVLKPHEVRKKFRKSLRMSSNPKQSGHWKYVQEFFIKLLHRCSCCIQQQDQQCWKVRQLTSMKQYVKSTICRSVFLPSHTISIIGAQSLMVNDALQTASVLLIPIPTSASLMAIKSLAPSPIIPTFSELQPNNF